MVDTLTRDNYVYIGMHIWHCKNPDAQYPTQWHGRGDFLFDQPRMAIYDPTFLNELKEAHSQGKNVLIMDEGFKSFTTEQRQLLIEEFSPNWNVELVLNYRREYELLPSGYNQNHKPNKFASNYPPLTVWPGEKNEDGVLGKALLPFDININEYYDTSRPPVSQL
jgi:hypothetical protein